MKVFDDEEYDSEDDGEVYVIKQKPKAAGPAPIVPENLAKRDLKTGSKLAFGSGNSPIKNNEGNILKKDVQISVQKKQE